MNGKLLERDAMISEILETIHDTQPRGFSQLYEKWTSIALSLRTPSIEIRKLRTDLTLNIIELSDVLGSLLSKWTLREPEKSTLEELIRVLRTYQLNSYAAALEKTFLQTDNAASTKTTPDFRDLISRQNANITKNLPKLLVMTRPYAMALAVLTAEGFWNEADDSEMGAIPSDHNKNKMLYKVILERPGMYEVFLNAMRETGQTGVVKLLQL